MKVNNKIWWVSNWGAFATNMKWSLNFECFEKSAKLIWWLGLFSHDVKWRKMEMGFKNLTNPWDLNKIPIYWVLGVTKLFKKFIGRYVGMYPWVIMWLFVFKTPLKYYRAFSFKYLWKPHSWSIAPNPPC